MTAVAEGPAATAPAITSDEVALERATQWANEYAARLTERTKRRLAELASHSNGVQSHIGEPTTGNPATGFYVAFDVVATSPIQFGGPPPYQPSKVIAAGERRSSSPSSSSTRPSTSRWAGRSRRASSSAAGPGG